LPKFTKKMEKLPLFCYLKGENYCALQITNSDKYIFSVTVIYPKMRKNFPKKWKKPSQFHGKNGK